MKPYWIVFIFGLLTTLIIFWGAIYLNKKGGYKWK